MSVVQLLLLIYHVVLPYLFHSEVNFEFVALASGFKGGLCGW